MSQFKIICLVLLLTLALSLAQKEVQTHLNPPSSGSSVDMRPILKTSLSLLQQILQAAEHQIEAEDKAAQRRPSVITNSDHESTYVIKYSQNEVVIEKQEHGKINKTKAAVIDSSGELGVSSMEEWTELKDLSISEEEWCDVCATSEGSQTSTQTTEMVDCTESIVSCTVYEEVPTVEKISISGNWPEVTMNWGLKEDVSEECIREFVARICQREGACVSGKVAADARRFSVPAQKNITSLYFNASITPVLVNGQSGLEQTTGYEEIDLCTEAAVKNVTWTTTSTSITVNWLAPDVAPSCFDYYTLTLTDEFRSRREKIMQDTHYTMNNLDPGMKYLVQIFVYYKTGLRSTFVSIKTDP